MLADGQAAAEALFGECRVGDDTRRAHRGQTSVAQVLTVLAEPAELFQSSDGRAWATVEVAGHRETWPVRGKRFKAWLGRAYYSKTRRPAPAQAMAEAIALIEAHALDGPEVAIHVRVAESEGSVYIDLADEARRVVEVDAAGWRVLPHAPVKFHRAAGMLALPEPVRGETLDLLRAFLNVGTESNWRLLVHLLIMALRPRGPYPVLGFFGEQGAAKSTATRIFRALVDPNAAPLRSEPREPRDLMIAAEHGWVVALDNVSHLPAWLSDALCRLSTGGGFSTRELFTDSEEIIFSAMRPVILNGIEEVITRGDLMQRTVIIELPVIAPGRRRAEAEFWPAFETARPVIFGGLLDAVAAALREAPNVRLPGLPRMADFAAWSMAAERGLRWPAGGFLTAYNENIASAHELVLDASPVAQAVRSLAGEGEWSGTVAELLATVADRVDDRTRRARGWPASPRALAGALRRLGSNLRAVGVEVTFLGRTKRGQHVHLAPCEIREQPSPPTPPTPSRPVPAPPGDGGDGGDDQIPTLNASPDEGEL